MESDFLGLGLSAPGPLQLQLQAVSEYSSTRTARERMMSCPSPLTFSTRYTVTPLRRRRYAVVSPAKPDPMTATRGLCCEKVMPVSISLSVPVGL